MPGKGNASTKAVEWGKMTVGANVSLGVTEGEYS